MRPGLRNYTCAWPNRRTKKRYVKLTLENKNIADVVTQYNHPYFWYYRQSWDRYCKHKEVLNGTQSR